jgi:hypothetical protein
MYDDEAMADPHPKVLNLTSEMMPLSAGAIKNTEIAKEVRLVSPHHERSGFPAFRISRRQAANALGHV